MLDDDEEDFFGGESQPKMLNGALGQIAVKPAIAQRHMPPQQRAQQQTPHHVAARLGVGASAASAAARSSPNVVLNSDNHYERQYACKHCAFFTNNPRAVLYHRRDAHRERINVHECRYCQYASQYSGKVERHTLLRHKIDMTTGAGGSSGNSGSTNNNQSASANNQQQIMSGSGGGGDDDEDGADNMDELVGGTKSSSSISSTSGGGSGGAMTANNIARFQCNKCPCKYKRSSDLSKHLRLKHGNHLKAYDLDMNGRNG